MPALNDPQPKTTTSIQPVDPIAVARVVNARWTAHNALASYRASQRPASPTEALAARCEALEWEVSALWEVVLRLEGAS